MDRMKPLKKPLPINGYEEVWMSINKVIGNNLSQIYIKGGVQLRAGEGCNGLTFGYVGRNVCLYWYIKLQLPFFQCEEHSTLYCS